MENQTKISVYRVPLGEPFILILPRLTSIWRFWVCGFWSLTLAHGNLILASIKFFYFSFIFFREKNRTTKIVSTSTNEASTVNILLKLHAHIIITTFTIYISTSIFLFLKMNSQNTKNITFSYHNTQIRCYHFIIFGGIKGWYKMGYKKITV